MDNLLCLSNDLQNRVYKHGPYTHFCITDPKPRDIHKSSIRDRVVHHLLYTALYPYFDTKFIYDSYSCRIGKGTHRAINRFHIFTNKVSKNRTKQCFVLKCDIRKFFASIDHPTLKQILKKHIEDKDILNLLENVIDSFHTINKTTGVPIYSNSAIARNEYIHQSKALVRGLPLGNLTSQLLVNIYMNEFDQFIKHKLKVKYYIRYADDFVVISDDKKELETLLIKIEEFLKVNLKLQLHPDKVYTKTIYSGIDFLGWVHFVKHRLLRTATKRRMMRNLILKKYKKGTVESYKGMLRYGNTYKLRRELGL